MIEEPRIIYEDKNFVAAAKPAGLLTHPLKDKNYKLKAEEYTLTDWLVRKYPEMKTVGDAPETCPTSHGRSPGGRVRPGIVHRLDKDTSGILLAARNQKYFKYLKSLFKNRQIKKTYLAVVFGRLRDKEGTIAKAVKIKKGTVKRTVFRGKMAKEALTHYRVKKVFKIGGEEFSFLEIVPETGRTHQIRVHLASIGHPIVGDRIYGFKKTAATRYPLPDTRLMLHAYSLEFSTEEGKRIKLEAEPPDTMMI